MRNTRDDVIDKALDVLDTYGLADLTMRRLGRELGVQPSAIYHHFPSKQVLLAAVADEILDRGAERASFGDGSVDGDAGAEATWTEQTRACCLGLRTALLAVRDGADVVATGVAFGFVERPLDSLIDALTGSGLDQDAVRAGAKTLLHFVLGHTIDEQAHAQAAGLGAIAPQHRDPHDFAFGLDVIVAGLERSLG